MQQDRENRDWNQERDSRNSPRNQQQNNDHFPKHRWGAGSYEEELRRDYSASGVFGRGQHRQQQESQQRQMASNQHHQQGNTNRNQYQPSGAINSGGNFDSDMGWERNRQEIAHNQQQQQRQSYASRPQSQVRAYGNNTIASGGRFDSDSANRNEWRQPSSGNQHPQDSERNQQYGRIRQEQDFLGYGITNMGGDYDREGSRTRHVQDQETPIYWNKFSEGEEHRGPEGHSHSQHSHSSFSWGSDPRNTPFEHSGSDRNHYRSGREDHPYDSGQRSQREDGERSFRSDNRDQDADRWNNAAMGNQGIGREASGSWEREANRFSPQQDNRQGNHRNQERDWERSQQSRNQHQHSNYIKSDNERWQERFGRNEHKPDREY